MSRRLAAQRQCFVVRDGARKALTGVSGQKMHFDKCIRGLGRPNPVEAHFVHGVFEPRARVLCNNGKIHTI